MKLKETSNMCLIDKNILIDILEECNSGVVIFNNQGCLIHANSCIKNILSDIGTHGKFIEELFQKMEKFGYGREDSEIWQLEEYKLTLKYLSTGDCKIAIILFENENIFDDIRNISNLNRSYQNLFEEYVDDTIWITDSKGKTLFAGDRNGINLGYEKDYFLNKNIYDLEKEGLFKPSVTAKVLENKRSEIVVQKTANGATCVALGIPYFDEDGQIERVMSISRNLDKQFDLGEKIIHGNALEPNKQTNATQLNFITCNKTMLENIHIAKLAAISNTSVLITGETGVGKSMLAKRIHSMSGRADKPCITVNCSSIPEEIFESELFGYDEGAFTGGAENGKTGLLEIADKGTVILDEICEIPFNCQAKLLEVMQEGMFTKVGATEKKHVDIRFISTTNQDIENNISNNRFRSDLYYRISTIEINIPALIDRKEDIPLLLKNFLNMYNQKYTSNTKISTNAYDKLVKHNWAGNTRELENTIEKLVVSYRNMLVDTKDIDLINDSFHGDNRVVVDYIVPLKAAISIGEKKLLMKAANEYSTEAEIAEVLGTSQSNISRKLKQYNLSINV